MPVLLFHLLAAPAPVVLSSDRLPRLGRVTIAKVLMLTVSCRDMLGFDLIESKWG